MQPTAKRVERRALVLASVACRASLEEEPESPVAKETHKRLLEWTRTAGIRREFEPKEWDDVRAPLGTLSARDRVDLSWRTEGLAMLAWALSRLELPPYDEQVDGPEIADALGFLDGEASPFASTPALRSKEELVWLANVTLAVHWRLRELTLRPGPLDFASFARECQWARMPVADLVLAEGDLALRGLPVFRVSESVLHECLSIARERQHAAHWLLGNEALYSEITCDT